MVDERALPDLLAANLRRLRIARHLSLSELARATSMSKATLSGIENARGNPTIDTLAALAGALRVPVADLLGEPPLGELRVVRASAPPDGLPGRLLEAFASGGPVELGELALPAGRAEEADARPAGTRAGVFVLEGRLIAGPAERSTELGPRDYLAFPADVPYVFEAVRRAARALVLTQAPA